VWLRGYFLEARFRFVRRMFVIDMSHHPLKYFPQTKSLSVRFLHPLPRA